MLFFIAGCCFGFICAVLWKDGREEQIQDYLETKTIFSRRLLRNAVHQVILHDDLPDDHQRWNRHCACYLCVALEESRRLPGDYKADKKLWKPATHMFWGRNE